MFSLHPRKLTTMPIQSMHGIFTYIYHKDQPNVGKYTSPMDPSWDGKNQPFEDVFPSSKKLGDFPVMELGNPGGCPFWLLYGYSTYQPPAGIELDVPNIW